MLIALVGTRFSGKSSVEEFFVEMHGFRAVRLSLPPVNTADPGSERTFPSQVTPYRSNERSLVFFSADDLLQHVTDNWKQNFITKDVHERRLVELFVRRPFFMLINIDAPLLIRFNRANDPALSLLDFIQEHDILVYGKSQNSNRERCSLLDLSDLVDVQVINSFKEKAKLHDHLSQLDLLDPELLRPGWDSYFMTLASLASQRSNCMKRRVGAVLVRENRVVSTGYNGTPRGLRNCNEDGCVYCNTNGSSDWFQCICLHAEENALLEAGYERVGSDAVLYCNTCPCLRCTIKIIQTGVKTVVYNLSYKVDEESSVLFSKAGVQLRRFNPDSHFRPHVSKTCMIRSFH